MQYSTHRCTYTCRQQDIRNCASLDTRGTPPESCQAVSFERAIQASGRYSHSSYTMISFAAKYSLAYTLLPYNCICLYSTLLCPHLTYLKEPPDPSAIGVGSANPLSLSSLSFMDDKALSYSLELFPLSSPDVQYTTLDLPYSVPPVPLRS